MNALVNRVKRLNALIAPTIAGGELHGLCIQVGRGEETKIKDLESDLQEVFPDDNYATWGYHRLVDSETFDNPVGKGDGNMYLVVSPMSLIVHTSDIFLSDRLVDLLSGESDILLVGRNFSSQELFTREFGAALDKFNYEKFFLFEIRYNLYSDSDKCR